MSNNSTSRVVFGECSEAETSSYDADLVTVGNVPYNMGEVRSQKFVQRVSDDVVQEQLIEVFKNVGQVVGFRYHVQLDHHVQH